MAQPAKHTPGPWLINQVQSEPEKITIIDADMCFVAEVWRTYVNGESRQQENAHLIAAAPAMYQELVKQRNWLLHIMKQVQAPASVMLGFEQSIKYLNLTLAQAEGFVK